VKERERERERGGREGGGGGEKVGHVVPIHGWYTTTPGTARGGVGGVDGG
jgi:hypothetical protein